MKHAQSLAAAVGELARVVDPAPDGHPSETDLMAELLVSGDGSIEGCEETYRLLAGVLLHDPQQLELLRDRTIRALREYDSKHDAMLLATVKAFLAHHGSTTDTAEAMGLHRHTVGYRLSRVEAVSGLSPYESEGREQLSLGIKADQIFAAHQRLRNLGRLAPPRHVKGGTTP